MQKLVIIALAALIAAGPLQAQANPDSVKHQNECRFAEQTVARGQSSPHLRWSLGYLRGCGTGAQGAAVALAVRRLRTETDTAALGPYWLVSRYVLDGQLFEAAESIAIDASASPQARVFAISALFSTMNEQAFARYENLVGGFRPDGLVAGGCRTLVSGRFRTTGTPLPSDFQARVAAVRERLLADDSQPLDVRTAATCLAPRRP